MKCITKWCKETPVPGSDQYPRKLAGQWRMVRPYSCLKCGAKWTEAEDVTDRKTYKAWVEETEEKAKKLKNLLFNNKTL